jgi:O-antigen/teichoic acid export membrane protein
VNEKRLTAHGAAPSAAEGGAASPVRTAAAALWHRFRAMDPMQRNALALLANTGITSVLGFAYWIAAARFYSPAVVGESAALISALLLLANIAELNLYNTLIRFLPTAGRRAGSYVLRAYLAVIGAGVVVGVVALPLLDSLTLLDQLLDVGWAGLTCFLGAVILFTLFALQDSVAIGLRAAIWVPVENALFGVGKLLLLVVFVGWGSLGIITSWLLSMLVVLIVMTLLVVWRLLPRHTATSAGAEPITRRQVAAFMTVDNLALIAATAGTHILPVVVATRAGTEANGYFFVAWAVGMALDVALVNAASSLVVEGARRRDELGALVLSLLRRLTLLTIPIVALVLLAAYPILLLYGSSYADNGSTLLRIVAISVLPRIVVVVWMSMNRVTGQLGRILFVEVAISGAVLSLSWYLLPTHGIVGVGYAHLAAQTAAAIAVAPGIIRVVVRPGGHSSPTGRQRSALADKGGCS